MWCVSWLNGFRAFVSKTEAEKFAKEKDVSIRFINTTESGRD